MCRFLIVTGMSGAGKTTALKVLEDIGYFCIDNLPVFLMIPFAKLLYMPDSTMGHVAVGIDIRNGKEALEELVTTLEQFEELQYDYEILYLDCSDYVLLKRFKETRRNHPLSKHDSVEAGIAKERNLITFLRERANYILDTSNLLTREFRSQLEKIFVLNSTFKNLMVTVVSFGYKYGLPLDADLVFDVRFLPNPYYDLELRNKTGNDKVIQDFVLNSPISQTFLQKLFDLFDFLIPNYIDEGKNSLVIAIGCTGGKHRSVTIANELYNHLSNNETIGVRIEHKNINNGNSNAKILE